MSNILLVEAPFHIKRARNLPIALQKIATIHLQKGDNVRFCKGIKRQKGNFFDQKQKPDKIYISTVFTYYGDQAVRCINYYKKTFPDSEILVGGILATLLPDFIESSTGIKPFVGVSEEIDSHIANFDLFTNYKDYQYNDQNGIVFTSRGCVRKCKFCGVKTIEPRFYVIENWKEQVDNAIKNNCNRILIQDNNFTATPFSHQVSVIEFIVKKYPHIEVDFNQAVDCRIFKEKHAKLYSNLNLAPLRFAFDGMQEDGYFQRAIEQCKKHGVFKRDNILVYTLYNFDDTPENMWYRINEIIKCGAVCYPMRYAPLTCTNRKQRNDHVGQHWTQKQLWNFSQVLRHLARLQIIPPRKHTLDFFERGKKYFVDMLNSDDIISTSQKKKLDNQKQVGYFFNN